MRNVGPSSSSIPFFPSCSSQPRDMLRLASVILLALLPLCFADRFTDLKKCVGSIPLTFPSDSKFTSLIALSFKNNVKHPLVIAEAASEAHVSTLVKCAREISIRVCARSGGHSLIGHSLCEGLLIDLHGMQSVSLSGTTAVIEPGAQLGAVLWTIHKGKRWLSAGVCPSVGFAGYVLGGGHGPYEGRLSIACDSLRSVRMVDRMGDVIVADAKKNKDLFWSMCGAGGGQFGIVTQFRMETAKVDTYDRGVVFRFRWPTEKGGEVIEKWQNYKEEGGSIWFRIEIYSATQETGVTGYGACYDVKSKSDCLKKLEKADFFQVEGRQEMFMSTVSNALDLHAFFGPSGDWGRKKVSNIKSALLDQNGKDAGAANARKYRSTLLKKSGKMNSKYWQKFVDFCQTQNGAKSMPWVLCQMNLFNGAIDKKRNNAFAFRDANLITHNIIGGGTEKDKMMGYNWITQHMKPFTVGVYVNYPELDLKKNYAKAYWGKSLTKLRKLKKKYDPKVFFMNPQPIAK